MKTKGRSRRSKKSRVPRPIANGNVLVTFDEVEQTVSNSSSIDTIIQDDFALSKCVGAVTWTVHYDSYRIVKVRYTLTPILTEVVNRPFDDTTSIVGTMPSVCFVLDKDGGETGILYTELRSRAHAKEYKATDTISRTFTPHRLLTVYRSGVSNAYRQDTDTKACLDTSYADVPHYGVKWGMTSASPSNAYVYKVTKKYWVEFCDRKI